MTQKWLSVRAGSPRTTASGPCPFSPSFLPNNYKDFNFVSSVSRTILNIRFLEMEFIKSIHSQLAKWFRLSSRPLALESSAFSRVPPELILHIAEYLPLVSASSFSICCRPIYFILGTQYLKALEESPLRLHEFVTLLERDLPDHSVCYLCRKLHAIDRAPRKLYAHKLRQPYYQTRCQFESLHPYIHTYDQEPCWEGVERVIAAFMSHQHFSLVQFQSATMYSCPIQDIDYSKILHLLSRKTCTSRRLGYVEQYSWGARIVGGSLLTREQTIFMLPAQPNRIPLNWDKGIEICCHIKPSWTDDILLHKGMLAKLRCFELKEPIDHKLGAIKKMQFLSDRISDRP
jgi:hypothetical protein